jgi:type I restriction enzyme S subunit
MAVKGQTDMADFVSLSDQRKMYMQLPAPQLQAAFASIVEPLIRLRASLDSESSSLGKMRDYLLPKLLSGTVRVKYAAEALEDTA